MGVIARTSFNTGDIPTAAEWNAQFDTAYNEINGALDANNLATDAVSAVKIQNGAVSKAKLGSIPQVVAFNIPTRPNTGTAKRSIVFPWAGTITKIVYKSNTTPAPEALVFDVTNSGSTIFTASAASATGTDTYTVTTGLQNTTVAANAVLNLDIDAIGTGTAGGEPFSLNIYIDVTGSSM